MISLATLAILLSAGGIAITGLERVTVEMLLNAAGVWAPVLAIVICAHSAAATTGAGVLSWNSESDPTASPTSPAFSTQEKGEDAKDDE